MPDTTQPKTPPVEPHTESSEKESIRKSQEEFVGDEATPSRDRSEAGADHGSESSDRSVEDGKLSGADRGSQSSDRAVEDASLSGVATDAVEGEDDPGDDDLDDEDDLDEMDVDEDPEEVADDEELTDDEAEVPSTAGRTLAVG